MAYPVIIRNIFGYLSYLVLDDHPRELLRHPGFQEEYSIRPWLGSTDPDDAREEWAEMLAEDLDGYRIVDSDNRDDCCDLSSWAHRLKNKRTILRQKHGGQYPGVAHQVAQQTKLVGLVGRMGHRHPHGHRQMLLAEEGGHG